MEVEEIKNENNKIDINYFIENNSEEINKSSINLLPNIKEQSKKVCKILKENGNFVTGFLCKIPFPNSSNLLPVLITSFKKFGNFDIIKRQKINLKFNNDKITKTLIINDERKIYSSNEKEYDITIIEIKDYDGFENNDFFKVDYSLINKNEIDNYFNFTKIIYLINYTKEMKMEINFCSLKDIFLSNSCIKFKCSKEKDSAGSPIFNAENFEIIGINRSIQEQNDYNVGTLLKGPIEAFFNEYKKAKNEIKLKLFVSKRERNQRIYFLDNEEYKYDKETGESLLNYHLRELSESNVKLFINYEKEEKKEYNFQKYFIPNKEGNYSITLEFKNQIKDCSYMFYNCTNLTEVDLSSFDTTITTDMSYMFYRCRLENIDLSSFDTTNVRDISYMFGGVLN